MPQDIASDTFGDDVEEMTASAAFGTDKIRLCHASRISVSFDVAKVDDMTAANFMHKLKTLLDDPELLLL